MVLWVAFLRLFRMDRSGRDLTVKSWQKQLCGLVEFEKGTALVGLRSQDERSFLQERNGDGSPRNLAESEAVLAGGVFEAWSAEGAHLLLQVRCAVLNNRLDSLFREWHPHFRKHRAISPLVV
jgi:hypothetical protein